MQTKHRTPPDPAPLLGRRTRRATLAADIQVMRTAVTTHRAALDARLLTPVEIERERIDLARSELALAGLYKNLAVLYRPGSPPALAMADAAAALDVHGTHLLDLVQLVEETTALVSGPAMDGGGSDG